jgi:DNA mismatch endonuclease (patch repair protein)
MDTLTREQRSERMRRVRQAGTKPELAVRHSLHALGFRYRLHRRDLPGSPDIVLPSKRVAMFVHGCFWHRHQGCSRATTPKTNTQYWLPKFAENEARDLRVIGALEAAGWRVRVIWQCETDHPERLDQSLLEFMLCSSGEEA